MATDASAGADESSGDGSGVFVISGCGEDSGDGDTTGVRVSTEIGDISGVGVALVSASTGVGDGSGVGVAISAFKSVGRFDTVSSEDFGEGDATISGSIFFGSTLVTGAVCVSSLVG